MMWVCLEDNARSDRAAPPLAVGMPPEGAVEIIHQALKSCSTFIPLSTDPQDVLVWGVHVTQCAACSKEHGAPCVHWRLATLDMRTQRLAYWRADWDRRATIGTWLSIVLSDAHSGLGVPVYVLPTLPTA